jgi:hypothetical protein
MLFRLRWVSTGLKVDELVMSGVGAGSLSFQDLESGLALLVVLYLKPMVSQ